MNYIDGFIEAFPPCFDTVESQDEAAAAHRIALDVLYSIGCKYDIKTADMKHLCFLAQIDFNELQKYPGVTA